MKKCIILCLLAVSWPVNNLHRAYRNEKPVQVFWYPGDRTAWEYQQWYIHDVCQDISYIMIFLAIWLAWKWRIRNKDTQTAITTILLLQCVDLVHYLGWHRRNEYIVAIEALIWVMAAIIILYRNGKSN